MGYLWKVAGVEPGPTTPDGVFARVVDGRTLFVNTRGEEKRVPIDGAKKGLISRRASANFDLCADGSGIYRMIVGGLGAEGRDDRNQIRIRLRLALLFSCI
jgi:hypothetical protein